MATGASLAATQSAELISRVQSGAPGAEEELVRLYWRPVFLLAVERTRDREAARDLAQDVLMAVLQAVREGKVRESDRLAAFVQGTARNLINNFFRSQSRRGECNLEAVLAISADPVREREAAEQSRLVRQELQSYSALDQQILLFSLVDGHSLAEVAERLKMSYEAVRARKSRLVRKITKKFSGLSQK